MAKARKSVRRKPGVRDLGVKREKGTRVRGGGISIGGLAGEAIIANAIGSIASDSTSDLRGTSPTPRPVPRPK